MKLAPLVKFDVRYIDGATHVTPAQRVRNWRAELLRPLKTNRRVSRVVTFLEKNGSWVQLEDWRRDDARDQAG